MLSFNKQEKLEIKKPVFLNGVNPDKDTGIDAICNGFNHNAEVLNQIYDYVEYLEKRISKLENKLRKYEEVKEVKENEQTKDMFDLMVKMVKEGKSIKEIEKATGGWGIKYVERGIKFPWQK